MPSQTYGQVPSGEDYCYQDRHTNIRHETPDSLDEQDVNTTTTISAETCLTDTIPTTTTEAKMSSSSSKEMTWENNKEHTNLIASTSFHDEDCNHHENDGHLFPQTRSVNDDDDGSSSHIDGSITTTTVDEAIELLGIGCFQLVVLTAAGLCFAADAMQVLLLSFLSQVLRIEWHLSDDETALITSMLFVGAVFGTLTLGPLADKKGRKPVFLLAASIISFFGTVTATVTDYRPLLATLFMVGWGIGGLTVPFDILAEFLPASVRGKSLLVIEYFWTIGVLFVVGLAYKTLGNGENSNAWRPFVVLCTIPCWISVLIGYYFVPESPRWLCTQGRCEEALTIIRKAAKFNKLDTEALFPPGTQLEDEEEEESDFFELFSPRWRWITLKLWGAWGFFAFGYYGTIMTITEVFNSNSETSVEGGPETYRFDYGAIFVSSSAELVGTTIAIFSVDVTGRIPLQVVAYALAGVSVTSLCLSASNNAQRYVLISLGFSSRTFEMIGSCVSWVSTAEILTTQVRTTGHSAANAVARIGALLSPFLIQGHSSLMMKGLVMLTIHAMTVICVSQLPETKGTHMGRAHQHDNETEDLVISGESELEPLPSALGSELRARCIT